MLVDDGLMETRQGVGPFVLRAEPVPRSGRRTRGVARGAIKRAIAALDKADIE